MATVGQASQQTGWSPRMLRYIERLGLVVPRRTGSRYRAYGLLELNQLRSLQELRRRYPSADVRDFHDEVLRHGALPLGILERLIDDRFATA